MTGESFRFIHAGDFHLERPLSDLDEVPQHLREPMAVAAWKSATTVFETAVIENVDFILLSGDLFHPIAAGPRGMSLLLDQFELMQQHNIQVFWTTGQVDDLSKLGDGVVFPPNVTLFPKDRAEQAYVRRSGETIAIVVGRSSDGRNSLHVPSYRHDPVDTFTIALGYGSSDASALAEGRFDYWALGGEHQRRELSGAAGVGANYCGTPQGRSLNEPGMHGFYLVDIDADGTSRAHFHEADSFRYINVELAGADLASTSDIRSLLSQRISRLQNENGDRHLLIGWEIHLGDDTPINAGDPAELLGWLRREFGHGSPAAWSTKIDVVAPPKFPKTWMEEDTILGDFLRAAKVHRQNGGRDLDLASFTEEHLDLSPALQSALAEADPTSRAITLDRATLLGVELLRGGKPNMVMGGESKKY